MSAHVPILTEVVVRAWGLEDPRVLTHLRAENQPGRWRRTEVLKERAKDAGWPVVYMLDSKKAATASLRKLEGMDLSHRGQSRSTAKRRFAEEQGQFGHPEGFASDDVAFRRESIGTDENAPSTGHTSIYDE